MHLLSIVLSQAEETQVPAEAEAADFGFFSSIANASFSEQVIMVVLLAVVVMLVVSLVHLPWDGVGCLRPQLLVVLCFASAPWVAASGCSGWRFWSF